MVQNYASCGSLGIYILFQEEMRLRKLGSLMWFQKAYNHQWAKCGWQSTLWLPGNSSTFQADLATDSFLNSCFSYLSPQFFFVSCQLNFYMSAISTLQKQIHLRGFHFHWQIICRNVDCHSLKPKAKMQEYVFYKCNQTEHCVMIKKNF